MSYQPSRLSLGSARRDSAQQTATNARIMLSLNPFMARNPDALMHVASSTTDMDELLDFGVASYGLTVGNNMAADLQRMDPARQRSLFGQLTMNQQMALQAIGYSAPERDDGGLFSDIMGGVGKVLSVPMRGIGEIGVGDFDIGHGMGLALKGLAWAGNQPGHLYRTIRLQDDASQWMGLLGAIVGGAAVIGSGIITGGASLAALGLIGGGAMLGAGAASLASSSIINPGDWFRAWNESWDGERTFDRAARARADAILGDPRLVGLAEDLAELDGLSLEDLATEMAGLKSASDSNQLGILNTLARRMGEEGTPEYQQAFQAMLNVLAVPEFQEAVQTLQNGKISPGRDLADALWFDKGSGWYNVVSGAVDLGFTLAVDPFLVMGTSTKVLRAARHGVRIVDGVPIKAELMDRFADDGVRLYHSKVVDAINGVQVRELAEGGAEEIGRSGIVNSAAMRSVGGSYKRIVPEVLNWMRQEQIAPGTLTVDQFQQFLIGAGDIAPVMRGVGTVQIGQRLIIEDYSHLRNAYRSLAQSVRATTQGMTDEMIERAYVRRVLKEAETEPDMMAFLPTGAQEYISKNGLIETPWLYQQERDQAYLFGRSVGKVMTDWLPISQVIEHMTTMAPAGRAISMVGDNAFRDITAMTETGAFLGMPSWVRRAWADAIITSGLTGAKHQLALGWLDSALTLAGGRSDERLAELVDAYLTKSRQIYGVNDSMMIGGRMRNLGTLSTQQANEILMPSLKELRRYAMRGKFARFMGIADLDIAEAAMNRVWKPAVLLRLAFIPRAIGEEGLAFLLRGGIGGLVQDFGARSIADMKVYDEAARKVSEGFVSSLTEGEKAVLLRGPWARLPKHVRGLMWTMNKLGWGDPTFDFLNNYGEFLRGALAKGIGIEGAQMGAVAAPRKLIGEVRQPFTVNAKAAAEAVFLGNKYSWRRMVLGGVDHDAVEAAVVFRSRFQTQMMRSLSASSAVEFGTVDDPRYIEVREVRDRATGKLKRQEYISVPGEREITSAADDGGAHNVAVLRRIAELHEDPVIGQAAQQVIALVKGGRITLSDQQVVEVLEGLRTLSPSMRTIVYEFLNNPQRDTFQGMLRYLSGKHPDLASYLKLASKDGDPDFDEIVNLVDGWAKGHRWDLQRQTDSDLATEQNAPGPDIVDVDAPVEPSYLYDAQRRRMMTRDELEQERIEQMAAERGDPIDYFDGYYDDVQFTDEEISRMESWSEHMAKEELRREMEVDAYADEFANVGEPWQGWFYDERGLPVDPDVPDATPEYLARLRAKQDELDAFEMEEAIIKWTVADADVKQFRGQLISQADADVQLFEDELVRLGGSIDSRTGRVVFHIHPSGSTGGEWDWWQGLDPRRRRGIAQRFLRRWGGMSGNRAVTTIDVLASEAGLTVDEWADQFVWYTSKYEDARRARSAYKKMPLRELREATRQAQLDELERYRPDIDPSVRDEVRAVEQSLNDPRRQAMVDAWRKQKRQREIPIGPDVEPDVRIPLTRAEEDQARRDSLAQAAFPEDDRSEFLTVDRPDVMDPKEVRRLDRELQARAIAESRIPPDDSWWMDEPGTVGEGKLYTVEFDPQTAEEWARQLRKVQPVIQFLRQQDDVTRGWMAALIRTMDRPGSGVQLSVLRSRVANGESPFYASMDDAHEDFVNALHSAVMNPYYNDGVQRSERIGDAVEEAQVRLYPVADFVGVKRLLEQNGTTLTYDMVLSHATDRKLIEANRDIVNAIIDSPRTGGTFLATADPRLAAELKGIQSQMKLGHRIVSDQRSMLITRDILDGRVLDEGAVVPLHKRFERMGKHGNQRTELWQLDSEMFGHRLEATPRSFSDRAREWAEVKAGEYRYFTTLQSRAMKKPRMRKLDDGTETPLVYQLDTGGPRPVTEPIDPTEKRRLMDDRGRPIDHSRTEYFDDIEAGPTGNEPAWEALGGIFEDMQDARFAGVRTLPKEEAKFASGRAIPSLDSTRVYRARVEHVERLGPNKPPVAWKERVQPRFESGWDKFVRYGFDKVIGGSIDAILRRPMAFHYFKQRYISNRDMVRWLIDPDLERKTETIRDQVAKLSEVDRLDVDGIADVARKMAAADGEKTATGWSRSEALAWLRGHSETELTDRVVRLHDRALVLKDPKLLEEIRQFRWYVKGPGMATSVFDPTIGAEAFLRYVESQLPPGLLQRPAELFSARGRRLIDANPVLKHLQTEDWETLRALDNNLSHIRDGASEAAAIAAIEDMLPFIDSHEFKTQFGEFGKGFLPFWYAEENFLKRWVRGLAMEGPAYVRKAQLGYMGLKQAGVIRTDENGKDWFIYPGSTLLADTLSKVAPKLGLAAQGIMFQTPTDALLPGLNQRFGTPAFNPLVTVPVEFLGMLDPAFKPIEQALSGGTYSDRGVWEQVVPTQLLRFYNAFRGDEESSKQHASAMMAAIAQLEANDQGLPDDATPHQREKFLDKVRDHARIIVFAQALAGFISPGAPSALNASPEEGFLGLGAEDPADVLNAQYLQLVRGLGLEAGTLEFLARHPQATIYDVVNPLPYTQSRSETLSGARIGVTTAAVEWYDANADYLSELPYAGPWLLPQEYVNTGTRSEVAYDQATALNLRSRLTPDEFLGNIKFKSASVEYFKQKGRFDDAIAVAQSRSDQATIEKLKARWEEYSTLFRASHPIFDDELTSGEARQRRRKILDEMRVAVSDPMAPPSDRVVQLRTVMDLFDRYRAHLGVMSQDRSAAGRSKVERLKANYQRRMNEIVNETPTLQSFWLGVLRPESSLD